MKFFPTIHFVDELPATKYEKRLSENEILLGFYRHSTREIYILKRENQHHTLIHELCHWVIRVFGNKKKLNQMLDRNNGREVPYRANQQMLAQLAKRKTGEK